MNKIDFAIIISAHHCNPNGDPLNQNQPRTDYDGYGIISDVCLKRKIRNRLQDLGAEILIVPNDRVTDGCMSVKARIDSHESLKNFMKKKDSESFIQESCRIYTDVRYFGQVFAFKPKSGGVSIPVRGPVSIGMARSLQTVDILPVSITKSTNNGTPEDGDEYHKDSTTISTKYIIDRGVYVAYGSIFPQLAEKTGFSDEDADLLKNAMATLLENDASSARPSGSMDSHLYWWTHSSSLGKANSTTVHKSLNISPLDTWPYFSCSPDSIPGINLETL